MDKLERFRAAYKYLYDSGKFHSKAELARILGRTRENVSGAYYGRHPFFNDSFLRSFVKEFPQINGNWLLYETGEMVNDIEDTQQQTAEPIQMYQALPVWANTFIDILTEQVKQNEALNRQLHQTINEVSTLKTELQQIIKQLKKNKL